METFTRWTGYIRTGVAFLIYISGAWLVVIDVYLQSDAEKAREAYELLFD